MYYLHLALVFHSLFIGIRYILGAGRLMTILTELSRPKCRGAAFYFVSSVAINRPAPDRRDKGTVCLKSVIGVWRLIRCQMMAIFVSLRIKRSNH